MIKSHSTVLFFALLSKAHQNDGPVCAFDKKYGNIREFASKEDAHLANYSIAHCGPCAFCSTWNDMEVLYSTRVSLLMYSLVRLNFFLEYPPPDCHILLTIFVL